MAKTIDELKTQSAEIKNATAVGENTATRVGTLFTDIVEHVGEYETGQTADTEANTLAIKNEAQARAKADEQLNTAIAKEKDAIYAKLEENEKYHVMTDTDSEYSDLSFVDENDKAILSVQDGYPKTKNFSGKSINENIKDINFKLEEIKNTLNIMSQKVLIPYRTFSILGDSYSTFKGCLTPDNALTWYPRKEGDNDVVNVEETWWHLLASEINALLLENVSWSGAPICYDGRGSGTIDAKTSSFVNRLQYITNPELLVIFGGTNDSWIGVGMGEYEYENWTDDNLIYFRPALAKLLHDAKNINIGMKIVFVLNTGLSSDINTSVETICEHYNVSLLKLKNIDKQSGHPSKTGMIAIKEQIINFLKY